MYNVFIVEYKIRFDFFTYQNDQIIYLHLVPPVR